VRTVAKEQQALRRDTATCPYPFDGPPDLRSAGDPYTWPVEAGAVRAFLEAVTGERQLIEQGFIVPLAFIGTCIRWTPAPESVVRRLRFDMTRMLHGTSWFQVLGEPLRVGDVLTVSEGHGNLTERPHRDGGHHAPGRRDTRHS